MNLWHPPSSVNIQPFLTPTLALTYVKYLLHLIRDAYITDLHKRVSPQSRSSLWSGATWGQGSPDNFTLGTPTIPPSLTWVVICVLLRSVWCICIKLWYRDLTLGKLPVRVLICKLHCPKPICILAAEVFLKRTNQECTP